MNNNIIYEDLPFKKQLYYYCFGNNQIIKNDPILKLGLSFRQEDINSILQLDNTEIIRNLYINREKIDKILSDSDEKEDVIEIKYEMCKKGLRDLFYLNLTINYKIEIINYKFDKIFIKEIYNNYIKERKNKFEQIMISKIILDLIKYYKLSEYYDEDKDFEEIKNFKEKTSTIIEQNLSIFKSLLLDFTKDDILAKSIDLLYKEIILSLIKLKFKDAIDIFNHLDLENIILSESITNELWETLKSKGFLDYFKINDLNDLFNSEKLQFFYIFFKYIFKSNFYLLNEEILQFRKNISEIIFSEQINEEKKKFSRKKKDIFFNEFTKKKYFIKKQIFFVLKSLFIYFYDRHQLKEIIKLDPYFLLDNSYFKFTLSERKKNGSPINDIKFIILKEEYSEIPKDLRIVELPQKYISLTDFMNDFKEKIENRCNNKYKLIITLKFKIVEHLEDKAYNIDCIYEFEKLDYEPDDEDCQNIVKKYRDENILVNGLSEGFEFLIDEINDESYNK